MIRSLKNNPNIDKNLNNFCQKLSYVNVNFQHDQIKISSIFLYASA